uniref:Uncharacterized protein n=1 Tax=Fagus sylvatica TaxID=28930 RepID=A0A2N9EUR7_FAGSY
MGRTRTRTRLTQPICQEIAEKAWKPSHPFQVKKADRNTFLFFFGHEVDCQLAFNHQRRTYGSKALVSRAYMARTGVCLIYFLGKVLEIDFISEPFPQWRKFVCARVEIDITKQLKPGIFLPKLGLPDIWIGLKYEKRSELCYKCGVIGHAAKDYNHERVLLSNQYGFGFLAYGEWIRSENDKEPLDIDTLTTESITLPEVTPVPAVNPIHSQVGPAMVVNEDDGQVDQVLTSTIPRTHNAVVSFAKLLASSLQHDNHSSKACMEHKDHLKRQYTSTLGDVADCVDPTEMHARSSQTHMIFFFERKSR